MAAFKKRTMERYDIEMPVRLSVDTEKGLQEALEVRTRNVSASGAYLQTARPLPEGTTVKLELTLPLEKFKIQDVQNARIVVNGNVIRTDAEGMAVCFEEKYEILPVIA